MPSLKHQALATVAKLYQRSYSQARAEKVIAKIASRRFEGDELPAEELRVGHQMSIDRSCGFDVVTMQRHGRAPRRTLLYVHGGGFAFPADQGHWRLALRLAGDIDARVVFPLFPLIPEHTHEDSYEQVLEVLRSLDGEVVVVADSAGAGFALSMVQRLRDEQAPLPSSMVLISPVLDLTDDLPGRAEAQRRDPWLSHDWVLFACQTWAGGSANARDPKFSPLRAELHDLPPTLVLAGTRDVTEIDAAELKRRADRANWPVTYRPAPGLLHVYPLLRIKEAEPAYGEILGFVQSVERQSLH